MKRWKHNFWLWKYTSLSFFRKSRIFCSMGDINGDEVSWSQTVILTNNFLTLLCYLLRFTPFLSDQIYSSCGRWTSCGHSGTPRLKITDWWLMIDCCNIDHVSRGYCIYHFTAPTHFRSIAYFPVVYTSASRNHIIYTTGTPGCQRSIFNTPSSLIFQNVYLWRFSSHPSPSLLTPTSSPSRMSKNWTNIRHLTWWPFNYKTITPF